MTYAELAERIRVGASTKVVGALVREMAATMLGAEEAARERLSGAVLTPRTGNLRRSIVSVVDDPAGYVVTGRLRAGGGAKEVGYARIHEEGGVILPVNARALAFPTQLAKTAVGANKVASPRQIPGLRLVWHKGSPRGYLVKDIVGRRARSEIWFILVGRVTMPKRPYLRPSVDEAARDMGPRMTRAVHRALGMAP